MTKAIELVGLQELAAKVGISYQAIRKFEKTEVSAERVLSVCAATEWRVTPHELRPDLYPHPKDGMPMHMREAA